MNIILKPTLIWRYSRFLLEVWKNYSFDDKSYYMGDLKEYANDKMFLINIIKNEKDLYKNVKSYYILK